jgi:hypothetical protein
MTPTPPRWAEALLRAFLKPRDVDSVSGDLLEAYRDSIHPARGPFGANAWYVMQVLGFALPTAGVWATLLAAAWIARTALDWFAPPVDFHTRAAVSTFLAVGLLLTTGAWASIRCGSFGERGVDFGARLVAGTCAGIAAAALAAIISVAGAAIVLALWHDPTTLAAIHDSGGLAEVFVLPFMLILPGWALGTIGGMAGAAIVWLRSVDELA